MTKEERIAEIKERLKNYSKVFHYIQSDQDSAADDFKSMLEIIEEQQREIAELNRELKIAWLSNKIDEREYLEYQVKKRQLNN